MQQEIRTLLSEILGTEEFGVDSTPDPAFGHYATNAAMRLASKEKKAPLEVARDLREKILARDSGKLFERVEVAGPGFLNFWLKKDALRKEFPKLLRFLLSSFRDFFLLYFCQQFSQPNILLYPRLLPIPARKTIFQEKCYLETGHSLFYPQSRNAERIYRFLLEEFLDNIFRLF